MKNQNQVKEERRPVKDITEVKKKKNLQGVDPPLQCRWDPEPKLSPRIQYQAPVQGQAQAQAQAQAGKQAGKLGWPFLGVLRASL
jgi:hypothetical protein